jgi:hypothetical protein
MGEGAATAVLPAQAHGHSFAQQGGEGQGFAQGPVHGLLPGQAFTLLLQDALQLGMDAETLRRGGEPFGQAPQLPLAG